MESTAPLTFSAPTLVARPGLEPTGPRTSTIPANTSSVAPAQISPNADAWEPAPASRPLVPMTRDSDSEKTPRPPAGSVITPPIAYYVAGRRLRKAGKMPETEAKYREAVAKEGGFESRLKRNVKSAEKPKKLLFFKKTQAEIDEAVKNAHEGHQSAVKKEATARAGKQVIKDAGWKGISREYGATGAVLAGGWTAVTSGYRNYKAVHANQKTVGTAALDVGQDVLVSGAAGALAGVAAGLLASRFPVGKLARVGSFVVGYFGSAAVSALSAEWFDRLALKARNIKD